MKQSRLTDFKELRDFVHKHNIFFLRNKRKFYFDRLMKNLNEIDEKKPLSKSLRIMKVSIISDYVKRAKIIDDEIRMRKRKIKSRRRKAK